MSPESDYLPPSTLVKSRSLESLRDAMSSSQEDLLAATTQADEVRLVKTDVKALHNHFSLRMVIPSEC